MRDRIFGVLEVQGKMILEKTKAKRVTFVAYQQAHVRACQEKYLTPHNSKRPLLMEINHGRWVGLCPECNSGIMTDPLWTEARCFDCGAVFHDVVWPKDRETIEELLLLRPVSNQNWKATETVSELAAQNIEHRLVKGLR